MIIDLVTSFISMGLPLDLLKTEKIFLSPKVPEIHKFEAMLKWAKHYVKKQGYTDKFDAKVDFRNCMDRLSRDLKLYRISPQDLIKELFKHSLHQTNNLFSFVKS